MNLAIFIREKSLHEKIPTYCTISTIGSIETCFIRYHEIGNNSSYEMVSRVLFGSEKPRHS